MSSIPISKTKIVPPRRRAELLTRRRLLDVLFEYLDRKLILVSAPAGYGKTSLLIDLAHNSELPCCWLALDELDCQPQRFIAYLIAAMAERFPKFGGQSSAVLNELNSLEQDMERLLVTLVNETYERIHEHFILVLDDYHLVEGIQPIHGFLNRFIQLVDENCHLIISSRTLSSFADLPLLVARDQVGGLGFSDLAFKVEEIQALVAQNNHLRLSDDEAKQVLEETEGWITGLQFTGAGFLHGDKIRPDSKTGVGLFDYLGQQVLDRQPPDLQDFLLRTSLLEEFDASLCKATLAPFYPEPQDWQGWIKAVTKNNLFALPVGSDGRWLRYHHLFRDFLQARLKQEHPEEVTPILSRLGEAYEKLGEWEKAHYTLKQLNDTGVLVEVIERASTHMLHRAHFTMESWLNDVPPSMLRTRPGLLSIRGAIAYMKGNLHEGLDLLDQAVLAFRQEKSSSALALALSRRATAHRFLGEYEASLRDADEVIQLTETDDDLRRIHAEALRVKGLALYRLGQVRQSVEFLENALNLCLHLNDKSGIPVLLMETGMAYRAVGNYTESVAAYEKALKIWREEGNLSWQANLLNNLGVLRHFQGEYEKAAVAYEEGLLYAQRSGYTRMEALISIGLGDLYAELEDFYVAKQNYQHADETVGGMDDLFLLNYLTLAQASLSLSQGNLTEARKMVNRAAAAIQTGQSNYEMGLFNLIQGRLYLLEDNPQQAITVLEEAERCFSQDGRELESTWSRLWLSAAYHQQGNRSASSQTIKTIVNGKSPIPHAVLIATHQARTWLDGLQKDAEVGRVMSDLFTRAGRLAARIPSLRRHLRRTARVVQVPAPPLIVQALGQAIVRVGGKSLTLSDWQTQSVRELFFYFLTRSRPMTKEQIGETLWPDISEPSRLKLRFKNEIYRLRRAIGQETIVFDDVFYTFNRAVDYEYDVEAFESFLQRARSSSVPVEQIEQYQKAVDLVRGPFLEDLYADWILIEREHLSQTYISALMTLADLLEGQGRIEQALTTCQRAIDYEPTLEAAYCLTMQLFDRIGDRASIRRTYQACQEAIQRVLGLSPSKETEDLYRRLVK